MNVMTLVADMIGSYMFFFQMQRHGHHFYVLFGTGSNDLVVAAHAQVFNLLALLYGKGANLLADFDVVGVWTMADFAGNCPMDAFEVHFSDVRVAGKITDNHLDWNAKSLELRFTITEGGDDMAVIYHGARPSGFQAGSNILVEGKYYSDGIFRANQLILKCPSKYESTE